MGRPGKYGTVGNPIWGGAHNPSPVQRHRHFAPRIFWKYNIKIYGLRCIFKAIKSLVQILADEWVALKYSRGITCPHQLDAGIATF